MNILRDDIMLTYAYYISIKMYLNRIVVDCFIKSLSNFKPYMYLQTLCKMKLKVSFIVCSLCNYVSGKQSTQQKELESLKSLIFENAQATVTLNSTDLKHLLTLSSSTLGKGMCLIIILFPISMLKHSQSD